MKNIDLNLGIKQASLITAQIIHENLKYIDFPQEKDNNVFVNTWAWYNGREQAIAITITNISEKPVNRRVIIFGEHRNSDSIFVDTWVDNRYSEAPEVQDFPEEAYKARVTFPHGEYHKAANHIIDLIKKDFEIQG